MAKKDVFAPVDTDHPAFRSWFGKSVLHDEGVPRTYYHGTSKDVDFKKFKMSRHGIWMTTDPEYASEYAVQNDSQGFRAEGWSMKPTNTASRVIPIHARIEKPFVGEMPQEVLGKENYKKAQSDWFDALRAQGYDGWVPKSKNGNLAVALGHPGQIKSALSNTGDYSETGDINKADGGSVDDQPQRELSPLGLYSHAAEMASQLPQERGSPQQMAAMLTNKYGVKPAEMEGFDEAFSNRPVVTRDEIAAHFKERMPQVEETVLGGRGKPEMDEAAKQKWIDDNAAQAAYNSGDIETIRDWRTASDDVQNWHREEVNRHFNELMATDPEFASRFQTIGDGGATKFQQYTLPGGENYREVLLKLPTSNTVAPLSANELHEFEDIRSIGTGLMTPSERERYYELLGRDADYRKGRDTSNDFRSSHWDEPNVLAHLRMADRKGPNNEKILHVEEIQSDWGQKGKKEGFVTKYNPEDIKEIDPANITSERRRNEFWNFQTPTGALDIPRNERFPTIEAARQHILDNVKPPGVPTAPYVTNTAAWTDLALKHVLHEAAHGDYDKVVWTPGAEQAKRYDLSKQVGKIYYDPELAGGTLAAEGLRPGQTILDKPNIKPENIADYIGKEAAEKLLLQPRDPNGMHMLEGDGLSMGGEGMKGYYDKIVPTQLSKLLKKLDPEAKIDTHNLVTKRGENLADEAALNENNQLIEANSFFDEDQGHYVHGYRVTTPEGQELGFFEDLPDAHDALAQALGSAKGPDTILKVPSLTITPKMRDAIKRGLPAFASGGSVDDDEDEGLTAYHGSPHDFERFDINKIGTGEGAQAYGHGLYFAENEPVAKQYRDNLLGRGAITSGSVDNLPDRWQMAIYETMKKPAGEIRDNAINELKSKIPSEYADQINSILSNKGHMYEVRIKAKPEHFLDWDEPLYRQPEAVRRLVGITPEYENEWFKWFKQDNDNLLSALENDGNYRAAKEPARPQGSLRMMMNGSDIYEHLHNKMGAIDWPIDADSSERANVRKKAAERVSQHLKENGVPGIRYLDAGSRGAGEGSRNYVVFDHDLVKVKRKYARGGSVAHA